MAARDASSMQLEGTQLHGRRYALRAPVDAYSIEFSDLSKNGNASSHSPAPPEPGDHSFSPPVKIDRRPSTPQPFQSAIPEPTAIVLFGVGLLFAQAANRRRHI